MASGPRGAAKVTLNQTWESSVLRSCGIALERTGKGPAMIVVANAEFAQS